MLSPRGRLQWAGVVSLGLHAAVLGGWLLWSLRAPPTRTAGSDNGAIELVMIEQQGSTPNSVPPAPPAATMPEPPPPDPAPPAAALAQPPPPEPAPAEVALPQPQPPSVATAAAAPAPPLPPAQPPNEPQPAPLRIDLRGDNSDSNTIVLPNPQVLPASVNARFHNKEPAYPAEAQRRAEQGAVVLLIHVAPDGLPAGVDVVSSSGHALLDRAATDAVWKWHFVPATRGGQPVPFDMTFRIVFQLD